MVPGVAPTTRVAAAGLFVVSEVLLFTGRLEVAVGWALLLAVMMAVCGARPSGVLRRALPAAPFILLAAIFLPFARPGPVWWQGEVAGWVVTMTVPGVEACALVLTKSALAVLAMAAVGETTSAAEGCRALQELRVPTLLVLVIALALRYLSVLRAEMATLLCARELRRCGRRVPGEARRLGSLVGTLFVRAFERAERVHGAMRLRGFAGEFRLLQSRGPGAADRLYLFGVCAGCVALGVLARW